ncbi:NAD(P)/FAD-dependent oxidoreductase [Allorhizobium borbori]|uniref:3-phenylpropionate/trans-cinnamate dioxygenase ferredoxin reductase subunit n=1 Tax=Allorhizobium borbori TaxID=485907 RepID=A0A7W6K632_9HYPH|nr:FAD-dependent oxidoreductase [Allorhizobium borbori]MBB4104810.1 3-phenylpropionate/trans-cinnamate dioxygenase ferredoxin reductase subunit [Allorhizobium borbori]
MTERLVIVGAGQAAFALAAKLRALKDERPITMIGDEPVPPYQRPPLSKKYLLGEMSFERLTYRPDAWFNENGMDLRLSTRVVKIDRAVKTVTLSDGSTLDYDVLVLATGATPRKLPVEIGGTLEGVFEVRNKADADRLAGEMRPGRHLLVVGGGYIGLEAAAVARKLGLEVVLIEAAERILRRVAAAETADAMRAIHEEHGVSIREKTGLVNLIGENGHVVAADLTDGSRVRADFVVVGIGVTANDSLAKDAGLDVAGGIIVDELGRTSDDSIFAAGDCAVFPYRGQPIRLESVQNAVDQAEAIAAVLAGEPRPYVPQPWFWSDQYDVKLQIAGYNAGYSETLVRPGSRPGALSIWYFRAGDLIAVDAINDAKAYVSGKKMLENGINPPKESLADSNFDLKQLLA